jgi:ABC-type ATPase involved in cell division
MIRFEEVSKRYPRAGDALVGVSFALDLSLIHI